MPRALSGFLRHLGVLQSKTGVDKMKNKQVDMLHGSIVKGLIALIIPIMIMNVTQSLFNIIDMAILGEFADDSAVGAVGVSGNLISLCTGLVIGIAAGANIIIAKRIGSGNIEASKNAVGTSMMISFVGGIIVLLIGVVGAETFLKLMNCPETLLSKAVLYFVLYFISVPGLYIYNFGAAVLRAVGDTKTPMKILVIGSIVKVVATYLFVGLVPMGVWGVGIATIISNLFIAIHVMIELNRDKEKTYFDTAHLKFYGSELKEILLVGIPAGLQSSFYSLANTVIMATVNSFGANATTGVSIANQFDNILYQITYSPSLAAAPYIAQNIGAGNIKRAKESVGKAILITIAVGATFGFLSAYFSGALSSLMTKTPEVIDFSRQKMIIVSSTYFICGINEVMGGTMRGIGKPIIPAVSTFIYMCVFRFVWVYFIFPFYPTLSFLYLVWPVGWILSIITLLVFYFPAITKLQKI